MISLIVVNYNGEKYIKKCLNSILSSSYLGFEITVIDDGSTDDSWKTMREYERDKKIKLLRLKENGGAAQARNIGAREAKENILFFLDVDTQVDADCLKQILHAFAKEKKLGAVQAKLVSGKSREIETVGHFLSPFGFPYEIKDPALLKQNSIFGGRSAALAIRREVFERIGGFDEDYVIYGEDTDLYWRVWLAGYIVRYLPQAEVVHYSKSSLDEKTNYRIFYEGAKNNTSNILKNAPLTTLFWILPLHVAGWVVVSLKFITEGRFNMAGWIYRGLWWNGKNLRKTLAKRQQIQSYTELDNSTRKIMFGPLGPKKLLQKSIQWVRQI